MSDHSKLSDSELCAAVAVRVLGWKQSLDEERWDQGPGNYTLISDDDLESTICSWSGIGLVVDAMREKGYGYMIQHGPNFRRDVTVEFYTEHKRNRGVAHEDAPWRAVHLAALAAREEK